MGFQTLNPVVRAVLSGFSEVMSSVRHGQSYTMMSINHTATTLQSHMKLPGEVLHYSA